MNQLSPRDKAILRGESKYIGSVCKRGHTPAVRDTKRGYCLACQQELMEARSTDTPKPYVDGASARSKGMPKAAPGILSDVMRYWWLAGWNDRDIELNGCTNLQTQPT